MKRITSFLFALIFATLMVGWCFVSAEGNVEKDIQPPYVRYYTVSKNHIKEGDVVDFYIEIEDANLHHLISAKNIYLKLAYDSAFQGDINNGNEIQEINYAENHKNIKIKLQLNNLTYTGENHAIKMIYGFQEGKTSYENLLSFNVKETMDASETEDVFFDRASEHLEKAQKTLEAQQWLNHTYKDQKGYIAVHENGLFDTDTSQGFISALQIELAMPDINGIFTKETKEVFDDAVKNTGDAVFENSHIIHLIQYALLCKGYNTVQITDSLDANTKEGILQLEKDAGFEENSQTIIDSFWIKALLDENIYQLVPDGDDKIRNMQRTLNRFLDHYCDVAPCDGIYGASTNLSLIYAWQFLEGIDAETANGNFGDLTKELSPSLPNDNRYDTDILQKFTLLTQYQLYCNQVDDAADLDFSGNYDSATINCVKNFQKFMCLPQQNGDIDVTTTMALLTTKGDAARSASGCDCSTKLNAERAAALYNDGYRYVGRYLTNVTGGRDKKMDLDEYIAISHAGLRVFPIFQQGGERKEHFSKSQGEEDCDLAVNAAQNLYMPEDTVIYFAVDYDFTDDEITQKIIPYFQEIHKQMRKGNYSSKYKIGVYGSRNVCLRVSEAGLAAFSFVNDASAKYVGNYSYQMPKNWAFEQFDEYLFSDDFSLSKNMVSGKDLGVALDTDYHGAVYHRDAAREYIEKFAKIPNKNYRRYTSDCANFVSQCLAAGGMPQNSAWYYGSYPNEPKNDADSSTAFHIGEAWRKAHTQFTFFSQPTNGYINGEVIMINSFNEIPNVIEKCKNEGKPIQVGDLIYFTSKGAGESGVQHAAIISSVDQNHIAFAAHSHHFKEESLGNRRLKNESVCIIRLKDTNH